MPGFRDNGGNVTPLFRHELATRTLLTQRLEEAGFDPGTFYEVAADVRAREVIDATAAAVLSFDTRETGFLRGIARRISREMPVAFSAQPELEPADTEAVSHMVNTDLPRLSEPMLRVYLYPSSVKRTMLPLQKVLDVYGGQIGEEEEETEESFQRGVLRGAIVGQSVLGLADAYFSDHLEERMRGEDLPDDDVAEEELREARRHVALRLAGAVATRYLGDAAWSLIGKTTPEDMHIIGLSLRSMAHERRQVSPSKNEEETSYALDYAYLPDEVDSLIEPFFS